MKYILTTGNDSMQTDSNLPTKHEDSGTHTDEYRKDSITDTVDRPRRSVQFSPTPCKSDAPQHMKLEKLTMEISQDYQLSATEVIQLLLQKRHLQIILPSNQ